MHLAQTFKGGSCKVYTQASKIMIGRRVYVLGAQGILFVAPYTTILPLCQRRCRLVLYVRFRRVALCFDAMIGRRISNNAGHAGPKKNCICLPWTYLIKPYARGPPVACSVCSIAAVLAFNSLFIGVSAVSIDEKLGEKAFKQGNCSSPADVCTFYLWPYIRSDGMHNVSKNMFKDSDDSECGIESDDERLEGWKPPTACGVDNSKALSSYEDIASGNVSPSRLLRSTLEPVHTCFAAHTDDHEAGNSSRDFNDA